MAVLVFDQTSPLCRTTVVLNKVDIFDDKIMYPDLGDLIRSYHGPRGDPIAAREFMWHHLIKDHRHQTNKIYPHFTCTTDTRNMDHVFLAVKDWLSQKLLKSTQIY